MQFSGHGSGVVVLGMKKLSLIAISLSILLSCSDGLLYTTKQGVAVFDPDGLCDIYGWCITEEHMTKCIDTISEVYPVKREWVDGLRVWFKPDPFMDKVGDQPTKPYGGQYSDWDIRLGLTYYCYDSSLAHELMHHYLLTYRGDSDSSHSCEECWEQGMVGEADVALWNAKL